MEEAKKLVSRQRSFIVNDGETGTDELLDEASRFAAVAVSNLHGEALKRALNLVEAASSFAAYFREGLDD